MKMQHVLVVIVCVTLGLVACKSKTISKTDVEIILKEWLGKSVVFPDIHPIVIRPKTIDTINHIVNNDKKYKILLYTDSTGCTGCKLQLHIWMTYIKELDSKVDFMFYFYPKADNSIISLLRYEFFNYPVFIDKNNKLKKLNRLSDNPSFQCFLLDRNNKVLAIGNPANNPQIWELYKKIITGEISDASE
jgi:hypothetical protein